MKYRSNIFAGGVERGYRRRGSIYFEKCGAECGGRIDKGSIRRNHKENNKSSGQNGIKAENVVHDRETVLYAKYMNYY